MLLASKARFAFFFIALILFLLAQASGGRPVRYTMMPDAQVRNVILFIGDGMGLAHLSASRMNVKGADGWYTIECMPVTSFVRTNSADDIVTDSAAGATAYATGHKTNNKMLSVSPDSIRLKTIVEAAREKGMATGLITMGDDITGATPAAFATHVLRRSFAEEIAAQYALSGVDILIGRGEKFFLPDSNGGTRKDGRNIVQEMRQKGYGVVRSIPELEAATSKKILGFIGLDSYGDDRIVGATRKALQVLSGNRKGFFLTGGTHTIPAPLSKGFNSSIMR
jgi:alkaline phosphatase